MSIVDTPHAATDVPVDPTNGRVTTTPIIGWRITNHTCAIHALLSAVAIAICAAGDTARPITT